MSDQKNKITDAMREALRKPLPPEAITQNASRTFLSSINAMYVVERMNDVFGVGGWTTTNEFVEKVEVQKKRKDGSVYNAWMVVVRSVWKWDDVRIESYGGNDNDDLGDAYKGACTDALTKIGSYLEIGIDIFKGKGDKKQDQGLSGGAVKQLSGDATPSQINTIKKIFAEKGTDVGKYEEKMGKPLEKMTKSEASNLISFLIGKK